MQAVSHTKYKVGVVDNTSTMLIPSPNRSNLKAFMGISLGNPKFDYKYMPSLFKWLSINFSSVRVIIADYIHRYSLQIQERLTSYDATLEALARGKEKYLELIELAQQNNIQLYNWYDGPVKAPHTYLMKFKQIFESNRSFKQDILKDAENYLIRKGIVDNEEKAMATQLSTEYILEELAFINYQVDTGYTISAYPGTQLNVIKKIATNSYDDIRLLNQLACIDMYIKK